MYIYKITNIKNDKVYIGQSVRPIEKRFRRHINDAKNNILDTHFARAIRKYGEESFKIELIDTAKTQEELTAKEQLWIRHYDSANPRYGYNETGAVYKSGGNTYINKTPDEMSDISQKISDSKAGALNPNAHRVKCFNIETGEELFFDTVKDCQLYFKEKTHRFITTRATNITHSLYKSVWKIAYANCEYPTFYQKTPKRGKEIEVYNIKNNTSTKYNSIRFASKELHISRSKIRGFNNESPLVIVDNRYIIKALN